jgi:hypothetical protein
MKSMETKPLASTNGVNETIPLQEIGLVPIRIYADVLNYISRYARADKDLTVLLEWDPKTSSLSHESTTAAYAVYQDLMMQKGDSPLPYHSWVKISRNVVLHMMHDIGEAQAELELTNGTEGMG